MLASLFLAVVPPQASTHSQPTRDPFCFRPLEEFCARDKCLTYAAQLETMQAGGYVVQVAIRDYERRRRDCTAAGTVARCGTLRITHRSDGFHAHTRYFDKAGTLIGASRDRCVPETRVSVLDALWAFNRMSSDQREATLQARCWPFQEGVNPCRRKRGTSPTGFEPVFWP